MSDGPIMKDGEQFDPDKATFDDISSYRIIDIRDPFTATSEPIEFLQTENIPFEAFGYGANEQIKQNEAVLITCYHGIDSLKLVKWMRGLGYTKVYSIVGGYERLRQLADKGHFKS